MKFTLVAVIIISFVAIAVFGVFAMNHGGGHAHGGCIASTANGAPCPDESNAFASIAFHLDAFKNFSTATFGGFIVSILLLALALVYAFHSLLSFRVNSSPNQTSFSKSLNEQHYPIEERIRHWLALHENSPAFS